MGAKDAWKERMAGNLKNAFLTDVVPKLVWKEEEGVSPSSRQMAGVTKAYCGVYDGWMVVVVDSRSGYHALVVTEQGDVKITEEEAKGLFDRARIQVNYPVNP